MRITVIGCGYLGAVHAACMAKLGHEVVGIDVDERKIADLSAAHAPFFEPGLEDLLGEVQQTGRLSFSTDMAAARGSSVHFICVGTPQKKGENAADLTFVDAATIGLLPYLSPGDVVVGKSTVPVGTAARLAGMINEAQPEAHLVWNPEFLREGHAVADTLRPDRLVYGIDRGSEEHDAVRVLDQVYAAPLASGTPRLVADLPTAELVKTAANSFLATKISFINAMAELCDAAGADVTLLADAIGLDDRIGRKFLNAGIGFGGGCLPKDIRAFMARAGELGADQALTFLREVDAINMRRRTRVVELARELCGGSLLGQRITVLGAAFKPESDDVRDSPALSIAAQLQLQGAVVTVTDPEALHNAARRFPELHYEASTEAALQRADALLLLTEWRQYRDLDPYEAAALVSSPKILDGRNSLDASKWRAAGWTYRGLGRP
ncbi:MULTISPECIES: UDP-glucose/GDP-mannose dehydrogenase family protein [unclassified Arthrobacter]|uniref:UDP-glucose dehydrogenase family protein n=1 Tax=unclassified Arthrobacter TaxID=235627 RepID=UPI001C85A587|nr:UDP-glucose/GDP-mannose dehydrogenase family protein [Arthrobacter sp. MAHUQ-56]MBX7444908.1 UDP-glucose/GDP-mannose dehydrogenase family protein [Arthrobacter sp. MAHUQ-56]